MPCWNCGKELPPFSGSSYRCADCDVQWVGKVFFTDGTLWNNYKTYTKFKDDAYKSTAQAWEVELIDFGLPGAPSAP